MSKLSVMIPSDRGFTLVELMVVVIIIAVLAAIAFPTYQQYLRRSSTAQAQQEMQKLAEQLERHKAKNFTYRGFDASYLYTSDTNTVISSFTPATQSLTLPLNVTGSAIKYTLSIRDASISTNPLLTDSTAVGQQWVIKAVSSDVKNFSLLLTSTGVQCKNKTAANITYADCGSVGSESW